MVALLCCGLVELASGSRSSAVTAYGSFQSPYSATSSLNTPIGANPNIAPDSAQIIAANFNSQTSWYGDMYAGGRTFYQSSASDPAYNIRFSESWGSNPFDQQVRASGGSGSCNPLHIPNTATVAPEFDAWMIIDDTTKPGLICEIWGTSKASGTWTGRWGGVYDINGNGDQELAGYGTGSGISAAALTVRASDIRAGVINHALVAPFSCNQPSQFVAPASSTDGDCAWTSGLMEGMRFQLDPSFNCASVHGGPIERMVCVALQRYGVIDGDNAGGTGPGPETQLGIHFETGDPTDPGRQSWDVPGDYTRPGGLYCLEGACGDYPQWSDIPATSLRLLAPNQPANAGNQSPPSAGSQSTPNAASAATRVSAAPTTRPSIPALVTSVGPSVPASEGHSTSTSSDKQADQRSVVTPHHRHHHRRRHHGHHGQVSPRVCNQMVQSWKVIFGACNGLS